MKDDNRLQRDMDVWWTMEQLANIIDEGRKRMKKQPTLLTIYTTVDTHFVLLDDALMDPIPNYKKEELLDFGDECVANYGVGGSDPIHKMVSGKGKIIRMTREEWDKIKGD